MPPTIERNLFEIFPDLPWPHPARSLSPQIGPSIQRPRPPATHVAGRRIKVRPPHADAALCRIRDIAYLEYARLKPRGQLSQTLRTIIAIADGAAEL